MKITPWLLIIFPLTIAAIYNPFFFFVVFPLFIMFVVGMVWLNVQE